MSNPNVTLTVIHGRMRGHEYVFPNHAWCVVGRAENCDLRLPMDSAHADISRHHCMLEIEWPTVRVRDLGSRNGTFVNEQMIGQRGDSDQGAEPDFRGSAGCELHNGDEIRIGHTVFRIDMAVPSELAEMPSPTYIV